jgi:phage shock protein A
MNDIMSKTKEISAEINVLSQNEQAVRQRITELKRLIEERKSRKQSLDNALKEEAALLAELEGI